MFQVIGGRSVQAARLLAPRSAVLVEAVRGRKSRTDPVAKSKEGRIKVPSPVDPVEMVVLKERYSEYELIMRALRYVYLEVRGDISVRNTVELFQVKYCYTNPKINAGLPDLPFCAYILHIAFKTRITYY